MVLIGVCVANRRKGPWPFDRFVGDATGDTMFGWINRYAHTQVIGPIFQTNVISVDTSI